jgi:hypothetical protein
MVHVTSHLGQDLDNAVFDLMEPYSRLAQLSFLLASSGPSQTRFQPPFLAQAHLIL